MNDDLRQYLRSLDKNSLAQEQADAICDTMLELDSASGPVPKTPRARMVAARYFLGLMAGQPANVIPSFLPVARR